MPRLQDEYKSTIVPALKEKLGRKNSHSLPKLTKITISMGTGSQTTDRKHLETVAEILTQIAGQKSQITRARKSVSAFKLREGMEIGCMVTLRGKKMYEFLDRLISLALPRVRDFRGLNPKGFDGRGNYSMGLNEILVFPEINPDKIHVDQGLNINIVTTANTNEEGKLLLTELGLPLQKA